jgi:hypothetical protein
MSILYDGTVTPSFLSVVDDSHETPGSLMTLTDTSLRVGEVIARYTPEDSANVSKIETEYLVMGNFRDGNSPMVTTPYRCVLADGFGTQGDFCRYSLRPRSADKRLEITDGAVVVFACINGNKAQAVILGCLRQPNYKIKDDIGRFYTFTFNGVQVKIIDNGELSLIVPGATQINGQADPNRSSDQGSPGATLTISPNGKIVINAGQKAAVVIDPQSGNIEIQTNGEVLLGGEDGSPATIPVSLSSITDSVFSTVRTWLNAHIHPTGMGPSGPPSSPLSSLESTAADKTKAV